MADEVNEIRTRFIAEGDKEVIGAYQKLTDRIELGRKNSDAFNASLAKARRESKVQELTQFYAQFSKTLGDSEKAASILVKRLGDIGATKDEIAGAAREFERLRTAQLAGGSSSSGINAGAIGRGLSGIGLAGLGDIANTVDDISDLAGQVKALGAAAKDSGGIGSLLSSITGLGPVGIAAGAGIAIASAALIAITNDSKEAAAAFQAELDARKSVARLVQDLTKEELEAQIEAARKDVETTKQLLDDTSYIRNQGFAEAQAQFGDLGARAAFAVAQILGTAPQVNQTQKSYEDLSNELLNQEATLRNLEAAYENNATAANDTAEATKKSTEAATQNYKNFLTTLDETAKKLADNVSKLKDVNAEIDAASTSREAQLANRTRDDRRAAEVSTLEAEIDAAKKQEEAEERRKRVADLRLEGSKAEAAALASQQSKIDQINNAFFQNELKNLRAYLLQESRATEDYNTQRVRDLEDLFTNLSDIAGRRDVSAFVSARTTGLTNLKRGDEDNTTASVRRRQDFELASAEADENRRRQLEDLRAANIKENTARREALNERINQEIAAGKGQLKQSEILQQQLAALRQKYQQEDLAARRRAEDEAYNAQITKLQQRKNEITRVIGGTLDPAGTAIVKFGGNVLDFVNKLRLAVSTFNSAPGTAGGGGYGGPSGKLGSFASGARNITQEGLYLLHRNERVLTAAENKAYVPSWGRGGGAPTVILNNPSFGDIATAGQVQAEFAAMIAGWNMATGGVNNG